MICRLNLRSHIQSFLKRIDDDDDDDKSLHQAYSVASKKQYRAKDNANDCELKTSKNY